MSKGSPQKRITGGSLVCSGCLFTRHRPIESNEGVLSVAGVGRVSVTLSGVVVTLYGNTLLSVTDGARTTLVINSDSEFRSPEVPSRLLDTTLSSVVLQDTTISGVWVCLCVCMCVCIFACCVCFDVLWSSGRRCGGSATQHDISCLSARRGHL